MKSSKNRGSHLQEATASLQLTRQALFLCVCALQHGRSHTPARPRVARATPVKMTMRLHIHITTTSARPPQRLRRRQCPGGINGLALLPGGATGSRATGTFSASADLPAASRRQRDEGPSRGVDGPSCPTGRRPAACVRPSARRVPRPGRRWFDRDLRELGRALQDPRNQTLKGAGTCKPPATYRGTCANWYTDWGEPDHHLGCVELCGRRLHRGRAVAGGT